jgi:hypothetical protein
MRKSEREGEGGMTQVAPIRVTRERVTNNVAWNRRAGSSEKSAAGSSSVRSGKSAAKNLGTARTALGGM